ncbi:MAG: outer membrane protein assembly factor BamE [Candidatus Hydrogenedentes bacterium]|nr:outer membrane protein assembly factor BamE [Candidatus Hydrogenedentota bacterium]
MASPANEAFHNGETAAGYKIGRRQMIFAAITAIVTFVTLSVALSASVIWSMNGHGANLDAFAKLQTGMSKDEVRALLGNPSNEKSNDWNYERFTWCLIQVHFDSNRATSFVHDH